MTRIILYIHINTLIVMMRAKFPFQSLIIYGWTKSLHKSPDAWKATRQTLKGVEPGARALGNPGRPI